MNQTVNDKVRHVVAVVLRVPVSELRENDSLGQLAEWDSLAQLELLAAIEEEFGLTIEPEEAVDLVSLQALVSHVEKNA